MSESNLASNGANAEPADAAQRRAALDTAHSFCVTAPAGSGKTELLSQRVLALLAGASQPEEILAITFTRKAAAEMRQRIVNALQFAATASEPIEPHRRLTWRLARAALERDAEQGWLLLENPARLRIQTIDGLCSSLIAQMPIVSNFGGVPQIAEQAQPLYLEAVNALLEQLEDGGAIADSLAALLRHLDNQVGRLQDLLLNLLACRDQWLPHIGGAGIGAQTAREHLESGLGEIRLAAVTRVQTAFANYAPELAPLLDFAATRLAQAQPDHALASLSGCVELPAATLEGVQEWQSIASWLLTGKDEWRKRLTLNEGFPPGIGSDKLLFQARKQSMQALLESFAESSTLRDALIELRHLPDAAYSDAQWQIIEDITTVLPMAVAQLTVVFQRRGAVDFAQVTLSAFAALGDALAPSDILLRLDARLKHLLIDEFQDTSATQFRLLQRLLEGWREHNESGASAQTLFIVGDGMQSIYGFREANVGLFLEARREGINGVTLRDTPLSVNFRSTPTVLDWVNRIFIDAFPAHEHVARGAVPYERAIPFNADHSASEVRVYGMQGDPLRSAEAQCCVRLVQQALALDDTGTIAILVRYRSHLRQLMPALQRTGISWRATDIDPLAQRAAIQDLLSLLKALLSPADRIAWLALLRSPLVGLNNADLHAVAGADGTASRQSVWKRLEAITAGEIAALSGAGAQAIARLVDVIGQAQAQRARLSLRSWLEGVWTALGGHLCLAGDADWRDVQVLLDLIEQLADNFSLEELERRLLGLYARPQTQLESRVVVMTIHKAKGLEFDTVIVPGLDRGGASDDKALLQWREYLSLAGSTKLVLAARPAFGAKEDATYSYLDYERKQKSRLEDTRLLYVAVTRAISRLYLLFVSDAPTAETDVPRAPPGNSLLARIWEGVAGTVEWSQAPLVSPQAVNDSTEPALYRVPSEWHIDTPSTAAAISAEGAAPLVANVDSVETRIGTAIHHVLEQLVRFGTQHWQKRSAAQRQVLAELLLKQNGMSVAEASSAAVVVQLAVDHSIRDARGQWLLRSDHLESKAEWKLVEAGQRFSIDRSFVDADGVRWIVDYKSTKPREGESLDAFLVRQSAAYKGQLLQYKTLVTALDARPIKTALYFPLLPYWHEILCD